MHYLYTDGGARGNPGPAASGAFLFDHNMQLLDFSGTYLRETTNNVAEYEALLEGLKMAHKNKVTEIRCHLDSELVVKQLNGEYKVKNDNMNRLYNRVKAEAEKFKQIEFAHIPRNKNKFADRMVNVILDAVQS